MEGRAKATYRAKEDCEISFQKGDSLLVEESETDWLRVLRRDTGTRGLCPVSYVDYDVPADRASSKDLLGMLGNVSSACAVCMCDDSRHHYGIVLPHILQLYMSDFLD